MLACDFSRLPRAAHAAALTTGLQQWQEKATIVQASTPSLAAFMQDMASDEGGAKILAAIFGNSPHITALLLQNPDILYQMSQSKLEDCFNFLLEETSQQFQAITDQPALMRLLRQLKAKGQLMVALADIGGLWNLVQITDALSDIAETALRLALSFLLKKAVKDGWLRVDNPEYPELESGYFILAMGKLGARELNYSSDIDLIIFYDPAKAKLVDETMAGHYFVRLTRELVRIMDERTEDGYVFRTDLRLRPDPSAMPLAVSVNTAEVYYASTGQNWERAAMIKARAVAGDYEAAESFLAMISAWVWRRSLDFAAVEDIRNIKRRIHSARGHQKLAVEGHDVKLGRGGIREIEFFVQTQQLIFGGRDWGLRASTTCGALASLSQSKRIAPESRDQLIRAYEFLRKTEHRLQMLADQQTHQLPSNSAELEAFACFMGFAHQQEFKNILLRHMRAVESHYAKLFEEAPSLAPMRSLVLNGSEEEDIAATAKLQEMGFHSAKNIVSRIKAWHYGRYRSTRTEKAREYLSQLTPSLLQAFSKASFPDEAFAHFDQFLEKLPAGVQLFTLLYQNPTLLDMLANIMGSAPALAAELSADPSLMDCLMTGGYLDELPFRQQLNNQLTQILARARHYEDSLTMLRRFVREHRFQAGVRILCGFSQGLTVNQFLADLAEITLQHVMRVVEQEYAIKHGVFEKGGAAIIALGQLGGGQMSASSDIDLIIVYDTGTGTDVSALSQGEKPLDAPRYFLGLTQRLVSAISAPTEAGKLYEVDLRLRPSGTKGPLAISVDGFEQYHATSAWTWEHMALCHSRVITGSSLLRQRLEGIIHYTLTRQRNLKQLWHDVADMRRRVAMEFPAKSLWDVKYTRGGLVDIAFTVQCLLLAHAWHNREILAPDTRQAIINLEQAGVLSETDAMILNEGLAVQRRVQAFLRLAGDGYQEDKMPSALLRSLASTILSATEQGTEIGTASGVGLHRAISRLVSLQEKCYGLYLRLVEQNDQEFEKEITP